MGGLGKTSLAQLVYKDESIKAHFERKAWVCVSYKFDVYRILKQILQSLTEGSCGDPLNYDALARKVQEYLAGKKYLLVLDDLWSEDAGDWERLLGVLVNGVEGNKILVTTRSQKVASVIGGKIHNLQKLTDDACWSIMQQKIPFPIPQNMINIGRDIAKKCDGVPFAARFLGSLLHLKREERDWVSINEDKNMWVQPENRRVISILKLSYDNLASPLKQCFSYYSKFPRDQKINREYFIRLWMAEGFIQLSDDTNEMSMEDVGKLYFNSLLGSSLIENAEMDELDIQKEESDCVKSFRLNELTHGLAQAVARDYAKESLLRFGLDGETFLSNANNLHTAVGVQGINRREMKLFRIKHLRVLELRKCRVRRLPGLSKMIHLRYLDLSDCRDLLFGQSISGLWYLQTLILCGCDSLTELPTDIGSLRNLRYLDISRTRISVLPNDVGAMEQLRHLDVSETNLKELPNSIQNLCELRTLKFDGCRFLEVLPSEFVNFTHLKCLDFTGTRIKILHQSITTGLSNLKTLKLMQCKLPEDIGVLKSLKHLIYEGNETPKGIRLLTGLRTLQQYVVSDGGLADLEGLNLLEKIKICNLENVKDLVHEDKGNLKGKQHIHCLDLHWTIWTSRSFHSRYICNDDEVLDALEPHTNLEILKIKNFMGSKLPQWIGDSLSSCLPKLVELVMVECNHLKQLPALGKLPNLKVLSICGMGTVRCLGNELYGGESTTSRNARLPQRIGDSLLYCLPKLVELVMAGCSQLNQLPALGELPNLKVLSIRGINHVQRLYRGESSTSENAPISPFPSLVELKLEYMGNLESWDAPVSTFPLLEKLTLSYCKKLKLIRTPFPSLKELKLQSCHLLENLPDIQLLEALQKFSVKDCNELKLSPNALKHIFSTAQVDIDTPLDAF
ncbi:hypothetical protein MKW94_001578 [Papaver nudicaule]|uniref:NB-ARC domain-containing protein n=1 Tax=Papaver nudicaule TaxID=74823 RepID=A0AA42AY45_PAPNU|nr:hypothetical protein [Papaver nudicaule]